MTDKSFVSVGAMRQAWFALALWLAAGLLLEGLIAFRAPSYLQDSIRRELFRLAHAHGTILSLLLLIAIMFVKDTIGVPPGIAFVSLRIGVLLMPLGFLLGGIWHYEGDPGIGIFLSPLGGLMILFGVVAIGLSIKSEQGT